MILKFFQFFFLLGILSGVIVFLIGFVKNLLIFPKGAFHLIRLWFLKEYYSENERALARKSLFMMIVGMLITLASLLFLYLSNQFLH